MKSGEFDRSLRFAAILSVGDAYIGSDEWLDAHLNASHFKNSVLLQNALYFGMLRGTGIERGTKDHHPVNEGIDVNGALADTFMMLYHMSQQQQEAVEQNRAMQDGKAL